MMKIDRFLPCATILVFFSKLTMFADEGRPPWDSLVTPTSIIGLSSGFHVGYEVTEGVNLEELKKYLREELKLRFAKRSFEVWTLGSLPPLERGIRTIDVIAFIYADITGQKFSMSYRDDPKRRNEKILKLLNSKVR